MTSITIRRDVKSALIALALNNFGNEDILGITDFGKLTEFPVAAYDSRRPYDCMGLMGLLIDVEDHFRLRVSDSEAANILEGTFGSIVNYIESNLPWG